jgi:hypothetical protein
MNSVNSIGDDDNVLLVDIAGQTNLAKISLLKSIFPSAASSVFFLDAGATSTIDMRVSPLEGVYVVTSNAGLHDGSSVAVLLPTIADQEKSFIIFLLIYGVSTSPSQIVLERADSDSFGESVVPIMSNTDVYSQCIFGNNYGLWEKIF